jgi:shikimate dehydrogenase
LSAEGPFEWREAPEAGFAVLGEPIAHSWSPRMQNAALAALGLPYRYVAVRVPPGELPEALDRLEGLGYIGANVTVPHKEAALEWANVREPFAARCGAANTVRFADGACRNTDGPALASTVRDLSPPSDSALLLGAGGAARSSALALVEAGYRLRIYNRTPERAERMVADLGVDAEVIPTPDAQGAGLIVNATSASLGGSSLAVEWPEDRGAVAYDLMYGETPSPFLQAAARQGLRVVDGRRMLVEQGALALEWWLERSAPREAMAGAIG